MAMGIPVFALFTPLYFILLTKGTKTNNKLNILQYSYILRLARDLAPSSTLLSDVSCELNSF